MYLPFIPGYRGDITGRPDDPRFGQGKIRLSRLRVGRGGYDSGVAFWGDGAKVYCARDENDAARFIRAKSRAEACAKMEIDPTRLVVPLSKKTT